MRVGDIAEVYMHWGDGEPIPGQPRPRNLVLKVEGDVVTLASDYHKGGKVKYSISSGRELYNDRDEPKAWDVWRLSKPREKETP